jgi:carbamoyl-phosphate synthase large subunit
LRHFFGFNEVEELLKYYLFGTEINKPNLRNGIVLRTWSDIFVNEQEFKTLKQKGEYENLKPEFFNFSLKE